MRIVGGRHRGRKLIGPSDRRIRPTSDRAREALFDLLEHRTPALRGARFLDLCAGTGAVGLEAYARGAAEVVLVENDPAALHLIRRNRALLGDPPAVRVLAADAARLPATIRAFDLVFLDPPYDAGSAGPILRGLQGGRLAGGALVIAEIRGRGTLARPAGFDLIEERRYGAARFVFLRPAEG